MEKKQTSISQASSQVNKVLILLFLTFILSLTFALATALAEYDYYAKRDAFISNKNWKNGAPWGDRGPIVSTYSSSGCCAYTADFVHEVWNVSGSAANRAHNSCSAEFYSPSQITTGDVIYCSGSSGTHWYAVLERYADGTLWTAERSGSSVRIGKTYYTVSKPGTSEGKLFVKGYHMPGYENVSIGKLDVNGYLDGKASSTLGNYGTFDIKIGTVSKNDVNDYSGTHNLNTSYSITDIKPKPGFDYVGVQSGSTSGKINTCATVKVVLSFATQGNLHVQGNLDGVADNSIADYGLFDVYINGTLKASDCTSFDEKFPKGTTYEVKNIRSTTGKNYDGVTSFTGTIRSNTESKVMLPYTTDGTATLEWQVGKALPGNLDRDTIDVEYKYTYTQQARTSPGADWTLLQEGPIQYENNGTQYESDNELSTSATRVLVGYYYFHWCNNGANANYYKKDYLPIKHTISMANANANFTVVEKGTDGDGSGRKYYNLTHKNGQYAGGTAKCGANGSPNYYRGGVYQNKKAFRINTYQKIGDWTSIYDTNATSTSVRWRLKEGLSTDYKGLQLNFMVDGNSVASLDGVAGLDIFINGEQKASNVTTFRSFFSGDFSYEIRLNHVANDKLYRRIEGGDLNGFVDEDLKTLTLYFETGVQATEDWKEIPSSLLPYIDEHTEIEYRHTYTQNARTTPGNDWTLIKQGATQYENDGAQYESDNELSTSATRVLVGYYYFHWCNNGVNANYYKKDYLPIKHTITMADAKANFTVEEKGTDGDGSGRKYYHLTHKNGPYAGSTAKCGANGSQVYYRGGVYQNKKAYQINTYSKAGDWTADLDTTASSIEYRIRQKRYTVSFETNEGEFEIDSIIKTSGIDLTLPVEVPTLALYNFTAWNTEPDGSGISYQPGSIFDMDQDVILYAQWSEVSSFVLPSGLKTIEEEAFAGIPAVIIHVPSGCTEIQSKAFLNCSDLKRIYIPSTVGSVALDAFDGCINLTICAPAGSTAIKVAKYNDIPYVEILNP